MSQLTSGKRKRRSGVAALPSIGGIEAAPVGLLDHVPLLIASVDQNLRYSYVNRKYGELFGLPPGRIQGRLVRDVLGPKRFRVIKGHIEKALGGERVHYEWQLTNGGGITKWLEVTYIPDLDARGRVRGFFALINDIEDRKRAAETLRRSEAPFRRLYESNIIGIIFADIHGNIFNSNDEFLRIVGYERKDLPLRWLDMTPPEWLPLDEEAIEQCMTKGVVSTWEKEYIRKDGSRVPILVAVAMLDMEAGTCICPVLDLSDRSRLEKALLEQSETERRRLGQDLHDGLGQHLTGLAFLGKALEERLRDRGSPEAKDAAKIATLAEQAVSKARSLAQLVSPVALHAGGLVPALTRLAANIQDVFDISCVVVPASEDMTTRDDGVATHLFHITQEAVTNAIKHGHAKSIRIRVRARDSRLTLSIQDDGIGMPEKPEPGEGLGLDIMRHRARMIGAAIEHRGSPGGGTTVVCTQHGFRHIATSKEAKDGNSASEGRRQKKKKKNPRRR